MTIVGWNEVPEEVRDKAWFVWKIDEDDEWQACDLYSKENERAYVRLSQSKTAGRCSSYPGLGTDEFWEMLCRTILQ